MSIYTRARAHTHTHTHTQLLAAVNERGAWGVWDTVSKQQVRAGLARGGGSHLYECLAVVFTHDGARVMVAGAVRERDKLVAGLDENVHPVVGGFVQEVEIATRGAEGAGAGSSALQNLPLFAGPIASLVTAWRAPAKTNIAKIADQGAPAGAGRGVVLARMKCADGTIFLLEHSSSSSKLAVASSISCPGQGGVAVVYPQPFSTVATALAAPDARGGGGEAAGSGGEASCGTAADDCRAPVVVAVGMRGVRLFDLGSGEEYGAGQYDNMYKARCHDLALVPSCTPRDKPPHMTWVIAVARRDVCLTRRCDVLYVHVFACMRPSI